MNWIKSVATLILSAGLAFVIAEVTLRIFDVGYGSAPMVRSERLHHVHPKNYEFLMHDPNNEYGGYLVNYDQNGYRTPNAGLADIFFENKKNSIVFLGDSFTEGNQVEYEHTFVNRISKQLNVQTLNLGVSSYSPILYLLQVKSEVKKLKSSLIVMQIYSNDFVNDSAYQASAIFDNSDIVKVDGGKNNFVTQVLRKSYLVRFLRKSQLTLMMLFKSKEKLLSTDLNDFEKSFFVEQAVSGENFKKTVSRIKQINNELGSQGKELAVFLIPNKSLSKINNCCEQDQMYFKFQRELRLHNINFLDVGKYFSDYKSQEKLFFDTDIHLTSDGHRLLSEALLKELEVMFYSRKEDDI